jgi:hypothetical protein
MSGHKKGITSPVSFGKQERNTPPMTHNYQYGRHTTLNFYQHVKRKNMKTNALWVFLMAIAAAFSGCNDNDTGPAQPAGSEEESLSNFALLATLSSNGARQGNDSTGTDTTRRGKGGNRCGLTEVEVTDLPAAVTDYIASNYAGTTVERAGKTDQNQFIVHIKKADGTHAGLLFEEDGTFVSEKTAQRGHGTPVAAADLPEAVTTYLSTNYSGATIDKAFQDTEGNLVVVLKKADGTRVGTAFDAAGNFTQEVTFKGKRGKKGPGR